ncbi:MAG: hypothetical protein WCA20_34160 [Candidatus Sulfotelmatobacter sp.]
MAMSYTFEGNAQESAKFEQEVFEARVFARDFTGAAEIANELARIYLESGDTAKAYKWHQSRYETAQHKPDLTDADKNLWLFRREHAQARIAARRGKANESSTTCSRRQSRATSQPSRPGPFLSLSHWLRHLLHRRLQDRHRRLTKSQPA